VLIREEGMRDGLQIERLGVTTDEKLRLLELLLDAGVTRVVVGSFVSPKWTPQMADTDELLARITPRPDVTYLALALNDRGRERAAAWTPPLTQPAPETHLHVDPVFLLRNTNRTVEQQEEGWRAPIERAVAEGAMAATIGLSAGWGSNWAGPFPQETRLALLRRQFDAWSEAGIPVTRIMMADPMGWNSPDVVADDLRAFRREFPSVRSFHLHLHNTRGLALTSAYAAIGALREGDELELDTGIGGLGGCPYCGNGQAAGMIPTEDLAQLLATMGIETGIDLFAIAEAAAFAQQIVGRELDGRVALAGPLPDAEHLYPEDVPVIETLAEAQHYRVGPTTYAGRGRPWLGEPRTLEEGRGS
jgi:hydroxymethylglutaryl-CoA lyase